MSPFTSSIAAFGAPFPEIIDDDVTPHPLNSYGAQKVMAMKPANARNLRADRAGEFMKLMSADQDSTNIRRMASAMKALRSSGIMAPNFRLLPWHST